MCAQTHLTNVPISRSWTPRHPVRPPVFWHRSGRAESPLTNPMTQTPKHRQLVLLRPHIPSSISTVSAHILGLHSASAALAVLPFRKMGRLDWAAISSPKSRPHFGSLEPHSIGRRHSFPLEMPQFQPASSASDVRLDDTQLHLATPSRLIFADDRGDCTCPLMLGMLRSRRQRAFIASWHVPEYLDGR